MALIIAETTVADYAKWREVFDSHPQARTAAGITNPRIFRNADNGNHILVIGDTADVAKTRQALESPDYKARMKESGNMAPPKIYVVE